MLLPGQSFDGYRLLRPIGSGGFGEIWICETEALGDLRALKFVASAHSERLDREFSALCLYRNAAGRLRSPALMPVEHANLRSDGLFYIMPLADGISGAAPSDPEWEPKTLAAVLARQTTEPGWFSSQQVEAWMGPILEGLQLLSDAGLVHRDVKPDNILFMNGTPCLSDISLLGEDAQQLTRRGTPGFSAPTWFVESGGHPDMYGAAMTLYSLLSGNAPDKMGRSTFRWPPRGEHSLSPGERKAWLNMHAVLHRAVDDRPAERFADFRQFARALAAPAAFADRDAGADPSSGKDFLPRRREGSKRKSVVPVLAAGVLVLGFGVSKLSDRGARTAADRDQPFENERTREKRAAEPPHAAPKTPPPGPGEAARAEIRAFEAALAEAVQTMTFPREKFAAEMEAVAADLEVLNPDNAVPPGTPQKPLSEIKTRFLDAVKALPPKPDVSTRGRVIEELRAAADGIGVKYGSALREPLEEKIRRLESELLTDSEFRKELGMKVLMRATRLVNIRPESWDIIRPAQNFWAKGEL
jgi:serine/threonine protein kinase